MGLIDGISPGGSIALGIIVGLLSTSVQSLGLTLQRKSHILEDEKVPYDVRRPPYRRRRWQLGMAMFIISNVLGSSVQISMLPLPVLSTLQASGLVFNSICATLILGEPFTRWSFWGTMLVCSGAVLIAVFGAIPSPAHSLAELLELLRRRPFVLWMSFQAVIVIGIAVATELVSSLTTLMQDPRFRLARGFAYGCISGILSAHSLLVAKSAVELIVRTIADGDNQFVHWQSWMLVLGLVTLALTQLYYLHRGLKLVSTSVLYPLIFCIYNIIAILDGLIYFRQTDLLTPLHACLIALGTVILLSGVLALSWRLSDEQHAPAVGQSTLAPGLGLVDDTEGEEEEEALLLRPALGDDEESALPTTQHTYQTFRPARPSDVARSSTTPAPQRQRPMMARPTRTTSSRWTERAEIWDELEDRSTPEPASPLLPYRRRSTTIPGAGAGAGAGPSTSSTASSPFLGRSSPNRAASSSADAAAATVATEEETDPLVPRRNFKRRRRSTGFPGFTARKGTSRTTSGGGLLQLPDAARQFWGLRWWGNRPRRTTTAPAVGGAAAAAAADPPPTTSLAPAYADEPLPLPPPPPPRPPIAAEGQAQGQRSSCSPSPPPPPSSAAREPRPLDPRSRSGSGTSGTWSGKVDDSPV